jgi:hypothetical protein
MKIIAGERKVPLEAVSVLFDVGAAIDYTWFIARGIVSLLCVTEEGASVYALAHYPDYRDGKRHELRVKTSRPGIQIRASRTSYTAPTL